MPSAGSYSRRKAAQLAKLVFFLDHQIGRYVVAEALRDAGAKVEPHVDHFKAAAPDVEWIPEVGRRGYESAALRGFVMTGHDMGGRRRLQIGNAVHDACVLHTDAHPDVLEPGQVRC